MTLDQFEQGVRWVAGVVGLAMLLYVTTRSLLAIRVPVSAEERHAGRAISLPVVAAAFIFFIAAGVLLWRPLPVTPPDSWRLALLLLGSPLYFGGMAFYLWSMRTLGGMFSATSGLGARLQAEHRLVTTGPYGLVRHPMYLGVILTAIGGTLIFLTWAMVAFIFMALELSVRAWREDRLLAREFGAEWESYAARVPGWLPRPRRRGDERYADGGADADADLKRD